MIFVWLVLTFTYTSTVILIILLKVYMDKSDPYPIIRNQRHKYSARRNLQPLRICSTYSAIAYTYYYLIHSALQEQASIRTCTEPASPLATDGLHYLILHDKNPPLFFNIRVMTNTQRTIHEPLFQEQQTWFKMTPLHWVAKTTAERKRIVLPVIGQRYNRRRRRRLLILFYLTKSMMRSMPR